MQHECNAAFGVAGDNDYLAGLLRHASLSSLPACVQCSTWCCRLQQKPGEACISVFIASMYAMQHLVLQVTVTTLQGW